MGKLNMTQSLVVDQSGINIEINIKTNAQEVVGNPAEMNREAAVLKGSKRQP